MKLLGTADVDEQPVRIEIAVRPSRRWTTRSVIVQVLGQALQGHVRNAGDQVQVIPVHVAVEDGDDFTARLQELAQLAPLGDATNVRGVLEPAIAFEHHFARRVMHQDHDRRHRSRKIGPQPLELFVWQTNTDVLRLESV